MGVKVTKFCWVRTWYVTFAGSTVNDGIKIECSMSVPSGEISVR